MTEAALATLGALFIVSLVFLAWALLTLMERFSSPWSILWRYMLLDVTLSTGWLMLLIVLL